jgi:hypothetical protein
MEQSTGQLPRFAIALNHRGRIIVDTSRTFNSAQVDDPASFVLMQA